MRWFGRLGASLLLVIAITWTTALNTNADRSCRRFRVAVVRENWSTLSAFVCNVDGVMRWLGVVPQAAVSEQRPVEDLGDGFAVSIADEQGFQHPVSLELYPSATGSPVVHLLSRVLWLTGGGEVVIEPGWRTLSPVEEIPVVLRRLGVVRTVVTSESPFQTATAPAADSGHGPDLVTLVFVALAIAGLAAVIRRRDIARDQRQT